MIIGQRTKGEYSTSYHFLEVEEIDDGDETYYCRYTSDSDETYYYRHTSNSIRHWFNFEDVNLINEV